MAHDFEKWMKGKTRKATSIFVILAAIKIIPDYVIPFFAFVGQYIPAHLRLVASNLLNVLVLFLILGFVIRQKPALSGERRTTSASVKRFHTVWKIFWGLFAVMYVYWTFLDYGFHLSPKDAYDDPPVWLWRRLVDNALSNATLVALFCSYVVLAGYSLRRYVLIAIAAWACLLAVEIVAIWAMSEMLTVSRMLKAMEMLVASLIWQMFLGGLACTVIALFVGRIESRAIAPPLWLIFLLYFYAALQPIAQAFDAAGPIMAAMGLEQLQKLVEIAEAAVTAGAFLLKLALFALVYWLMDTGLLLFYFFWLDERADGVGSLAKEREKFLVALHGNGG